MKVDLFIPCLVEQFHPMVGEATAKVLVRAGVEVSYPKGQTCCGQPLYKSGDRKGSRPLARHFIRLFENSEAVVAPSGSCVSMVRNYYPELFRDDARWYDRAVELGKKVYELTEFLVRVLNVTDLGARWEGKAVYHDSCQVSRALGIREEPRVLLQQVRGLQLVEMERPDLCCGFGGTFSLQFPAISETMVQEKAHHILACGVDILVSAEISCLMNLGGYLQKQGHPVRAVHIAEVLAQTDAP